MEAQNNAGAPDSAPVKNPDAALTWKEFFKSAPPRPKLRVVFLGLLGLCTVVLSIYFVVKIISFQKEPQVVEETSAVPPSPSASAPAEGAPAEQPALAMELKDLSVPLQSRGSNQSGYAQFAIYMEAESESAKQWMDLNRAHIISVTLETATTFSLDDFHSPEGLTSLKSRLLETYQREFGKNAPKNISIRDWIMN